MAEYLASIFGTEKDKVNCSFYFKIGACRHGDRCSRIHNKPNFSQTILIQNLYQNPQNMPLGPDGQPIEGPPPVSDEVAQEHFDDFFEDVFVELEDKYGEIEEMNVCDNLGDHLIGNVYVKFRREEDAERAVKELNNRWFNGRPIYAELSPVTDFREACCRQYEMGECTRSGFCNFMHLKPISRELRRELYGRKRPGRSTSKTRDRRRRSRTPESRSERRRRSRSKEVRDHKRRRSRSRSKEPKKRTSERRSRSRERKAGRSEDRDRGRDKDRERDRRDRKDNGSHLEHDENSVDSKIFEKEQLQNAIVSNLNEILGQESSQYGGTEESQDVKAEPDDPNVALYTNSNQDSNQLYFAEFGPKKDDSDYERDQYPGYEAQDY